MLKSMALFFYGAAHACYLAQQGPFGPPAAKLTYAPDRQYDLLNVDVKLEVDYPKRKFWGSTTNTLAPLRTGLSELKLHAGQKLNVSKVTVDGLDAKFRRDNEDLYFPVPTTVRGRKVTVTVHYVSENQRAGGFGSEGGLHWIEPQEGTPNREGFWTQGETNYNRHWAPTWDYPNDFATTSTTVTVQKDWTVIGNGSLTQDVIKGNKRTMRWEMKQPHATYLISLCAGPFDIAKDKWRDIDLWYVVPKGFGSLIPGSFGDTKDMLEFYSTKFGVKYPWPKYAQNAMYDFGGGMENISATTLGFGNLTDERSGFYNMSSLNAHELGHQWFGDLVSCKDWGSTWLNESFATFSEAFYFEHARGKNEYEREIEGQIRGYLQEARRYQRPLATRMYPNDDAMFDSHSYPKGAAVMFTLRKIIGDEGFLKGIQTYLTRHRNSPVESSDLCQSLTDGSGYNCERFFDEWVYKPGHPTIEYSWTYDEAAKSVKVNVKQVQNTASGTPIYTTIFTNIATISGGRTTRTNVHVDAADETFSIASPTKPDAVVFDADVKFLRQMNHTLAAEERLPVVLSNINGVYRSNALISLLEATVSDNDLSAILRVLAADKHQFPVFENLQRLSTVNNPMLRSFWNAELKHKSEARRRYAVLGLRTLGLVGDEQSRLDAMVNAKEQYSVVLAVLNTLPQNSSWPVLSRAAAIPSLRNVIRDAAHEKIIALKRPEAKGMVLAAAKDLIARSPEMAGFGAMRNLERLPYDADVRAVVSLALGSGQSRTVSTATTIASREGDKLLLPALKKAINDTRLNAAAKRRVETVIQELEKA